ncbi:MAG: DUF2804 domain-containing protein [Actinobacteria bacterium]|nr:DUF2804 domain-containing protein [Actinomycetota bacterium]
MNEREITAPVSLTTPNGALNPAALGWTRTALHDTSGIGRGHWGRNKRWEYWNVMTPTHILAATVSGIDYLALHSVWVLDRATQESVETTVLDPGARSVTLPPSIGQGPARARTKTLSLDIDELADGTRLRGSTPRVSFDITVERPAGHETLGVVVPWRTPRGIRRFQYTVKDVARPARGTLTIDGVEHEVSQAWGVLDHGRGRWPYDVRWNWAAGSGVVEGRVVGLQLGSKWTDGSGATENALVVDGRLTKISEELVWDYDTEDWMRPWRIHGESADLTFTPFYDKHSRTNALLITTRTNQLFGTWTGWVRDETGEHVAVDGIEGWAEDVHNRW